jgi:osmotically-inducible protein OsmY
MRLRSSFAAALLLASTPVIGQDRSTPSPAPDNTRANKQRSLEGAPTADKASNEKSDLEMAAAIRRAIVEDDSLSTYAKNVKIVARDGAVHLVGPVRSEQEKRLVEELARKQAGAAKVTSDIQVSPQR